MTWQTVAVGLAGAVGLYLFIALGGWVFDKWYDWTERNNKW